MRLSSGLAGALLPALALAAVWPMPAAAKGGAACRFHGTRIFARRADLPAGALAALGLPLAERGAPFQATDVRMPGPALPANRFLDARQSGCTLVIRYEHGGFAYYRAAATLELRPAGWAVLERDRPLRR